MFNQLGVDVPITYKEAEMAEYFGLQPTAVRGSLNVTTSYYDRILLNIIFSVFKIGIPTEGLVMKIPKNYLRFWLFIHGTYTTLYTKRFGWIISPYSVSEFDFYYQPKQLLVSNRFFDEAKIGLVGVNCEITKIFDDYRGVTDIVRNYSELLAACDKAINLNLIHIGRGKMVGVPDKKTGDTIKEAFSQTTDGTPIVTLSKEILDELTVDKLLADLGTPFFGDKIHELKRSIMNDFLTTVGINNANVNKKERLVTDEVNANNDEVETIKSVILENLTESFEATNKLSGLNFTVEERFDSSYINRMVEKAVGGVANE